MRPIPLLLTALVALAPAPAGAATLRVAAASSAQEPLSMIARDYERETHEHVAFSFGSSGKLYQQISHGAPFDLFFSADTGYAQGLVKAGLASDETRYAEGRLALWVRQDSGLDPARGLALLRDPRVRHVAIANPRLAPYGRAAEQALGHAGLLDAVRPKLVLGENISQTAQFVDAGAADAGLLALSLAVSPRLAPRGRYWLVPVAWHEPITADAVVIEASSRQDAARRFLDYAIGKKAVWKRFGLGT